MTYAIQVNSPPRNLTFKGELTTLLEINSTSGTFKFSCSTEATLVTTSSNISYHSTVSS